jgi:co-chaperonin GroES (HSP10)
MNSVLGRTPFASAQATAGRRRCVAVRAEALEIPSGFKKVGAWGPGVAEIAGGWPCSRLPGASLPAPSMRVGITRMHQAPCARIGANEWTAAALASGACHAAAAARPSPRPARRLAANSARARVAPTSLLRQVVPKGDRVLVKVAEQEEKTRGGILLPVSAQKRPTSGEHEGGGWGRVHEQTGLSAPQGHGLQRNDRSISTASAVRPLRPVRRCPSPPERLAASRRRPCLPSPGDVVALGDGRLADGTVKPFYLKQGQTVSPRAWDSALADAFWQFDAFPCGS